MLNSSGLISSILGFVIVISIVICKYFNIPKIFLLIIIFIPIIYYIDNNKNIEETIINFSKFFIVSGILGYVVAKIIGLFFSGFD